MLRVIRWCLVWWRPVSVLPLFDVFLVNVASLDSIRHERLLEFLLLHSHKSWIPKFQLSLVLVDLRFQERFFRFVLFVNLSLLLKVLFDCLHLQIKFLQLLFHLLVFFLLLINFLLMAKDLIGVILLLSLYFFLLHLVNVLILFDSCSNSFELSVKLRNLNLDLFCNLFLSLDITLQLLFELNVRHHVVTDIANSMLFFV